MSDNHYWVYIPGVDEAGCVVQATSPEAAFQDGCNKLMPDPGLEIEVCLVGTNHSFTSDEWKPEGV